MVWWVSTRSKEQLGVARVQVRQAQIDLRMSRECAAPVVSANKRLETGFVIDCSTLTSVRTGFENAVKYDFDRFQIPATGA